MVELVNLVASGQFNREFDTEAIYSTSLPPIDQFTEEDQRVYFKFDESGPTVSLSTKGFYLISGAKSFEEAKNVQALLHDFLNEIGATVDSHIESELKTNNCVYATTVAESVDLNALCLVLGIENVEYEPEQFPQVVYRPDDQNCVVLVFSTGKAIVTGTTSEETAKQAVENVKQKVDVV